MIEIVSDFVVKDESRGQFELAFGPGGAWSDLFASYPGFRGTTLLRDAESLRHYLVIECWDTTDQREAVLAERSGEYAGLVRALADWSASRTEVGVFRVLAEATVRPHTGARRARLGQARRGKSRVSS